MIVLLDMSTINGDLKASVVSQNSSVHNIWLSLKQAGGVTTFEETLQ